MARPLWELLIAEPSSLDCDECFMVMEHFAEILARNGNAPLPGMQKYLARCPDCTIEHRRALRRLAAPHPEEKTPASSRVTECGEGGKS
jgi:hypothetical protein